MNITIVTHHPDWTGATGSHSFLFISDSDPAALAAQVTNNTHWRWYKPDTGQWYTYNPNTTSWGLEYDGFDALNVGTLHIADGGSLTVGDDSGITGTFEGTFKKIVIKNGIITEFEVE
ncbi:hypothetical protein LCGC14_1799900 [marine sediment metagenome]|uniref:Uncharacterized protein n=1 Tax=marine sediment metagenome TaxID=412755 RepID=A0A0F9J4R5_9ZZZZ